MKTLVFIFGILILFSSQFRAQTTYSTFCHDMDIAPFSFLDDLVPTDKDSTLEINVKAVVFQPSVGVGEWATFTDTILNYFINEINADWANLLAPDYGPPNVPWVKKTKIRLVLTSFSTVTNTAIYNDTRTATTTAMYDTTAINLFFGDCGPEDCRTKASTTPGKAIYVRPTNPLYKLTSDVAHEVGHCLGLEHVITGTFSSVSPPEACCSKIFATDYARIPANIFNTASLVAAPCGSSGYNNNYMSYNFQCRRNFSPRQIAIMHYHLRTTMQNVLTAQSKTYALTVNPAYNDTIDSDELWTADRYMKGNVIVMPNKKLSITCLVAMAKNAKIIVQKKGCLISEGILTNISGKMWKGVQVEGDPTKTQAIGSNFYSTEQGIAWFFLGAKVSNALIGVRNYITDSNHQTLYNTVGGMIYGASASFINNVKDVEFISYSYPSNSSFYLCQFKTTKALNDGNQPDAHVSIWQNSGLVFKGCNFEYQAGNPYAVYGHGVGIRSLDASYLVDAYQSTPCVFKKLTTGVEALNTINSNVATVRNSYFLDNEKDGAYFQNMTNFKFAYNYLRMPCTVSPMGNGLYLNECQGYVVKNNIFEDSCSGNGIGMYARLSKDGWHNIYRNTFKNLYLGLNAVDNNSGLTNITDGLKINCNDFSQVSNTYDIMVSGSGTGTNSPTVKKVQGAVSAPAANNLVRNKYGASCWNQNKWYTVTNSTKVVDHGTNSDAATKPLPQPTCSINSKVNVVPTNISLNYTLHCLPSLPEEGSNDDNPFERKAAIDSYFSTLHSMGSSADPFEYLGAMSSLIECYSGDTLAPHYKDSVISILLNNPGNVSDIYRHRAMAYLNNRDFSAASSAVSAMPTGRSEIKTLLNTLIGIYQEEEGVYSINTHTATLAQLEEYADTDGMEGQGIAQALLKFVRSNVYEEPRPLPEEGGERVARFDPASEQGVIVEGVSVKLYPNPNQGDLTLNYSSENGERVKVEVRDLLGKQIYTNFIENGTSTAIHLGDVTNGVYILRLEGQKGTIYRRKVIKQE